MRVHTIDRHPKRAQIIRALIRGVTYKTVAAKYGVSIASLQRYMSDQLLPRAAQQALVTSEVTGRTVLKQTQDVMERLHKMYDACDAWLRDPGDPAKYAIGPRAEEVGIVYRGKDGALHRTHLSTLLEEVRGKGGPRAVSIQMSMADPRRLILDTADTIGRQLDRIGRILGLIKDIHIHITQIDEWPAIQALVINLAGQDPKRREQIGRALDKIIGDASTAGN